MLHIRLIILVSQLILLADSFHLPCVIPRSHNAILSRSSKRKRKTVVYSPLAMTAERTTTAPEGSAATPAGKKRPLRSIHTMIPNRGSSSLPSSSGRKRIASVGDIVTVELELTPENGYVPENLFDASGKVSFVLGWGNYLPGLHELLLTGMSVGDEVTNVSIDAGFGRHNPDMLIEVPKTNLKKVQNMEKIVPNATLNLQGGIKVIVVDVTQDTIIVDANHPLAGSSYSCNLKVLSVDPCPFDKLEFHEEDGEEKKQLSSSSSPFEVATFAMGCFWGVELAFMRTPGVVGTRAGYTQGIENPSYEEIKEGHTGHREAVMVIYDPRVVSYEEILAVYNERLAETAPEYFKLDIFAEEDEDEENSPDSQYKHGLYFHNAEQERLAREYVSSIKDSRYCDVELKPASMFYSADDHHQQYLYKGGQAARKGCRETIRCYG